MGKRPGTLWDWKLWEVYWSKSGRRRRRRRRRIGWEKEKVVKDSLLWKILETLP